MLAFIEDTITFMLSTLLVLLFTVGVLFVVGHLVGKGGDNLEYREFKVGTMPCVETPSGVTCDWSKY